MPSDGSGVNRSPIGRAGGEGATTTSGVKYYKKQLEEMGLSFFRMEWTADYPDPDSFLYSMFHSSKLGHGQLF
jgi:ABC-type transport system substrate-binding protein